MSNVSQWDVVAGNNTATPPNGWPEGMQRSSVNDSARENMAALARWYKDGNGSLTSAGSGSAYTLTTNAADAALSDTSLLVFRAHATNTPAPTLNRDGIGAKTIKAADGSDLKQGVIVANKVVAVAYNATDDTFNLINGADGLFNRLFARGDNSELTIATGAITPTANSHTVDTESDAATDDLTDIDDANMPGDGARLTLRANNTGRTVVVKNGTGTHKIHTADGSDISLDDDEKSIELELRAGEWYEISRSATVSSITSGTAQATTSGTAFDFTGIPSGTVRITVNFLDVSLSGTDNLLVQIGDSGGVEATGYSAASLRHIGFGDHGGNASFTTGFGIDMTAASEAVDGRMVLELIDNSTNTWIATFVGYHAVHVTGAGSKALSGTLDRVRLTRSGSNTFDAGQVNILYE